MCLAWPLFASENVMLYNTDAVFGHIEQPAWGKSRMNDDPHQESSGTHVTDAIAVMPELPVPPGLRNIWRKWLNVTTRPSVASFARELPTANWYDIFTSLLALGLWSAIIDLVFQRSAAQILPISHWDGTFADMTVPNWVAALAYMVFLPLVFLAFVGLFYAIARGVGGKGTFLDQAYATALYYVPVVAIVTIMNRVPVVGHTIGIVVSVYEIALMAIAIAASQRIKIGRSVLVLVVTPVLLFLATFVIVSVVVTLGVTSHHFISPR